MGSWSCDSGCRGVGVLGVIRYGSVCSGIEAASVAWKPLGWQAAFLSEIEKFPSAVLAHHHPNVPNLGDMTKYKDWSDDAIDLLVGGTPCQSFSIAGLRQGLADPRGNLMLTYLAIARRYQPRWLVWENVPGVLSSDKGRDFATFVRGLEELGYHAAWRVLDAQFVRVDGYGRAVPQRRRRVFVVGYLGDWRRAAAVLLEPEGMQGDSAPRREKGKGASVSVAPCLRAGGNQTGGDRPYGTDVGAMCAESGPNTHWSRGVSGTQTLLSGYIQPVSFAIQERAVSENVDAGPQGKGWQEGVGYTLEARNKVQSVALSIMPQNSGKDYKARQVDVAQPIMAGGPVGGNQGGDYIQEAWAVRRLTPTECERLQGFPDGYTNIPWRGKEASDGPRYKALGNSMAVNVMRWLGRRIDMVERLSESEAA
ncbi:DNA cytosine methyltransferase [Mesorhizobium sp. Root172]|uniref:DNA cytosine methyltransferase n=1 Tax=Mesorhizobium sp. Root172 TaxID=1736481 RepID=UPI0039B751E3